MKQCPVCSTVMEISFTEIILNKYQVDYSLCPECGLLQTEAPYWLEESYSNAISLTDTGLVSRNLSISRRLTVILSIFSDKNSSYLDVAGGTGLFVRLMRDIGFNFYWKDKYCENIHAKGFESNSTIYPCNSITAFEVLEHLENPIEFIENELKEAGANTLIFTTTLFNDIPPKPDQWDYYSFETGQHITFYQHKTLLHIAKKMHMNLYSYKGFHVLTKKSFSFLLYTVCISRLSLVLYLFIVKFMKSKTIQDHYEMKKSLGLRIKN